jgi:hypothetical protein
VGGCELHLNTSIAAIRGMPPLPRTSGAAVTVNATNYSFDDANHDDTQGAWYAEVIKYANLGEMALVTLGGGRPIYVSNINVFSTDGASFPDAGALTLDAATKCATAYGDSLFRVSRGDNWSSETAYDGAFNNTLSKINTGGRADGTAALSVALIRNIRRYDLDYVEAQAKIDELMS